MFGSNSLSCSRLLGPNVQIRRNYTKMSKLYRPVNVIPPATPKKSTPSELKPSQPKIPPPPESISKSQRLMIDNGLMHQSNASGTYHLLPVAVKSLDKLIHIIDKFMKSISCQKMKMPILASSHLMDITGRLDDFGSELLQLKDRHSHDLLLCPTHEEAICDLIARIGLSHRTLPLRLYQITEKFRDELRPRFGLLRGREFLMKDLYTFDADEKSALATYEEVNEVYSKLFDFIGVKWIKAEGSTGLIGGNLSHEFHLISDVGEDHVLICNDCQSAFNQEVLNIEIEKIKVMKGASSLAGIDSEPLSCKQCGNQSLVKSLAIEVGHSFLLGTKYSKPFQASYTCESPAGKELLHMGCYGIGVTRLLASVIEVLSTSSEIRWPLPLAPYLVAVLPPKEGSKEEKAMEEGLLDKTTKYLDELLPSDVLLDDRTSSTIGKRLNDIKKLGIPFAIVFGKQIRETVPKIEFIDVYSGNVSLLTKHELFSHIYNLKSEWTSL